MQRSVDCLEIGAAQDEAELSVFIMHGLGATNEDFADVAMALSQAAKPRKWRFVLPQAPTQPVTINMGMSMPAWYDFLDLSQPRQVNWDTVEQSGQAIEALIDQETAPRIVLAGFSQGAAMALHLGLRRPTAIAGILMMSGYLLESESHPCPKQTREFPIAILQGSNDPIVPLAAAEATANDLKAAGYEPTIKVYEGMEHSVCDQEIRDILVWLESLG